MAFDIDMPAAARRHLLAADDLAKGPHRAVAAYLYGIAAECAFKAMMIDAGLRRKQQGKDPFLVHFSELRTMLRDILQNRRGTPLIKYVQNDAFMNNWSIRMRYSHGRDIEERWINDWAVQARQAVASIGS